MSRSGVRGAAPPVISGYRFIRDLGAGGNARVFLYEQDLPRREVAVKVLNDSALSEAARRRFTAEANVTASLSHRHIVQVFDAKVTDDGRPYLVMPYYPKPNLSVRARRAHFPVAEVLRTGIQVGSAVETSHRAGVLHRDIKPQNILTDSYGEPALTDFGIATTKGGDGPAGLSVPWSPPEILYGSAPGDERSDVYSLGATLWHLLAGRSPFEQPDGDNKALALMGRIKAGPVPPTGRADVPESLERLLRQAMAKDPAGRPQTAMELIRGLQSVEQELRLPVTHPILPSGESTGDAPSGDTAAFHSVRTGETTHSRGHDPARGALGSQPPWTPGPERDFDNGGRSAWDPAGQPDPRTHARDAGQPPWGQTSRTPRSDSLPDTTIMRGPRATPPAADDRHADDPTRARGPRLIDPWHPAPGTREPHIREPENRGGIPVPADSRGWTADGPGHRVRQFPPEAPEPATRARPRSVAPGGAVSAGPTGAGARGRPAAGFGAGTEAVAFDAGDPDRRGGRGRALALAGAGAALAVVAGVTVLVLSHGGPTGSTPAGTVGQTQPGPADNALGQGAPDPPVFNKPKPLSGTRVEFSWTEAGGQSGDVFQWQISPPVSKGWPATTKYEFTVTVPSGQTVCYVVRDERGGQASNPSAPACWP